MWCCRDSRHSSSIRYPTVKIQEIVQIGIEGSFSTQRLDSYMSQNLHCDRLMMFHQWRIENKEVLVFHIRVKSVNSVRTHTNQTLTP